MAATRPVLAWLSTGALAIGCLAAGAWALPQWQEAKQLEAQSVAPSISAQPVAPAISQGAPAPLDTAGLAERLGGILDELNQGTVSARVIDANSGEVIFEREADAQRIPASNMKMLVHYAGVVTAPNTRFKTAVTLAEDGALTLVAGGDTLLVPGPSDPTRVMGRAGIETLAERTITALKEQGKTAQNFTLNLDTTIYSGPALNPEWHEDDIASGFMSAVTPLAFYSHYTPGSNGASGDRPDDAPAQVHQALLEALNRLGAEAGLTFTGGNTLDAPSQGTELAAVESATWAEQSALMMQETDNSLAEVLGRNLSVARGGDGSATDAVQQIRAVLTEQGLPTDYTQTDLSGLSMNNKVPSTLLTALTQRATNGSATERLTLPGLPIAGYNGTLGLPNRFNDANETAGRGYVRAKTGTLNSVLSLSGYTVTSDNRPLIFSVTMNDLESTDAAKNTIDRFAAELTAG